MIIQTIDATTAIATSQRIATTISINVMTTAIKKTAAIHTDEIIPEEAAFENQPILGDCPTGFIYFFIWKIIIVVRWSEYTSVGKVIPEARIIAFKTPLKGQYFGEDSIPFGVEELLTEIKKLGGELGLVVDLTYTTKYYDPISFTDKGIEYKKIFCPGRDFEEWVNFNVVFLKK